MPDLWSTSTTTVYRPLVLLHRRQGQRTCSRRRTRTSVASLIRSIMTVMPVHIRPIRMPNPRLPPRLVPDKLIPVFEKRFSRTEAIFWYLAQLNGCKLGYAHDKGDFKDLYRATRKVGSLTLPDTPYMRVLGQYIVDWFPTGFQKGEGWILSQGTFSTVSGPSDTKSIRLE